MADQVRPKPSYNPVGWGTLFFTFWLTLITVPKVGICQVAIAWIFFGLSCLLWLATFIPPLDKPIAKLVAHQNILSLILIITLFVWIMGSLTVLHDVPKSFQIIVVAGTALWMIVYLAIVIWNSKHKQRITRLGIGMSVFFILLGIIAFFHKLPRDEPWLIIAFGIILLMITLSKSKIGREFPLV